MHHINHGKVTSILQEYRVRDAKHSRNFKFTFNETGFYRTIRRRAAEKLKTIGTKRGEFMSKVCVCCFYFCNRWIFDLKFIKCHHKISVIVFLAPPTGFY